MFENSKIPGASDHGLVPLPPHVPAADLLAPGSSHYTESRLPSSEVAGLLSSTSGDLGALSLRASSAPDSPPDSMTLAPAETEGSAESAEPPDLAAENGGPGDPPLTPPGGASRHEEEPPRKFGLDLVDRSGPRDPIEVEDVKRVFMGAVVACAEQDRAFVVPGERSEQDRLELSGYIADEGILADVTIYDGSTMTLTLRPEAAGPNDSGKTYEYTYESSRPGDDEPVELRVQDKGAVATPPTPEQVTQRIETFGQAEPAGEPVGLTEVLYVAGILDAVKGAALGEGATMDGGFVPESRPPIDDEEAGRAGQVYAEWAQAFQADPPTDWQRDGEGLHHQYAITYGGQSEIVAMAIANTVDLGPVVTLSYDNEWAAALTPMRQQLLKTNAFDGHPLIPAIDWAEQFGPGRSVADLGPDDPLPHDVSKNLAQQEQTLFAGIRLTTVVRYSLKEDGTLQEERHFEARDPATNVVARTRTQTTTIDRRGLQRLRRHLHEGKPSYL